MTNPPAGWYPDPGGVARYRYWTGAAWTSQLSPPPAPEPAPEQPPAEPPVQSEVPAQTGIPAHPEVPAPLPSGTVPPVAFAPPVGLPAPARPAGAVRLGPAGQVLSGWWRRLGGYVIDLVVISIVAAVILVVVAAVTGGFGTLIDTATWNDLLAKAEANPGYQPTEAELQRLLGPGLLPFVTWLWVVSLVLSFGNGVLLVAASGQTIGDRVMGIRKVTAARTVPGFGAATLRWLIPAVLVLLQAAPLLGVLALATWILDYLWPLWDVRSQALHDKAARTYVERTALAGPVNR